MMKSTALHGFFLAAAMIFGGCDGATPIGAGDTTMWMSPDPDEGLAPAEIVITNASAGARAPGLSTGAGVANVLMGEFSATAYGRTTLTNAITACTVGSAGPNDIKNIKLYAGTTQIGPTVERLDGTCATFPFPTPVTQLVGQTVTYRLGADIVAGVNRYAQFTLTDATSIVARDRAGTPAKTSLNAGSWPMDLSYITIGWGSLVAGPDDRFTNQFILTATERTDTIASTLLFALGEAIRVTSLKVDLVFSNGLQPSDLTNLKIVDDALGTICSGMMITPMDNPRLTCTGLNHVIPANGVGREWTQATFRAGAHGTVQACLNVTGATGFTSSAPIVVNPVCGVPMTVSGL